MKILYIIGNGFDMAQGMKTDYKSFYTYLKTKVDESSPQLLQRLVKECQEDIELWSDMEKALGIFTEKAESAEEFNEMYFILSEHLQEYLKIECDKFTPTDTHKRKILNNMSSPIRGLGTLDKERYREIVDKFLNPTIKEYCVISLNYTLTVERLTGSTSNENQWAIKIPDTGCVHLHGILDDTIIVGVDNESQITNTQFKNDDDIKDCLIKLQSNIVMKETRHQTCERVIKGANVIILFGVSLGETDSRWWKLIGNQLIQNKQYVVIYHVYKKSLHPLRKQEMGSIERNARKHLYEMMEIDYDDEIDKRIFITINSKIFDIE